MKILILALLIGPLNAAMHLCTPLDVGLFGNRMHIQCGNPVEGIKFFAYPSSNRTLFDSYLGLAQQGIVSGRRLFIFYDLADRSGLSYGCLVSDCRPIQGLVVSKFSNCRGDFDCPDGKVCNSFNNECITPYTTCNDGILTVMGRSRYNESCEPYGCLGNECRTNCSLSAHCASGYVCYRDQQKCLRPE